MSELKVNTISEVTGANGVTVDGLSIKDSKLVTANSVIEANMSADSVDSDSYVDGSIDTAHIADAQITTAKLSTAVFTGATDIGAAIVDADLFLMDDGAGGTIRKTTAARIKTYAGTSGDVTTIDSLFKADIKIGEDDQTKIDFETADEIHLYAANAEQVFVSDGVFGPQTDSDVDLGTTGVRFKDAYIDTITTTGASLFPTLGVITAKDLGAGIHIRTADSGASVDSNGDELVLENSGNTGMTILSGTSNSGGIYFGDSGNNNIGYIEYGHNTNSLSMATGGTANSLVIDSTGAVTKPLQPAFLATLSGSQDNVAINATTTVEFDTEVFDQNADFNTTNFTFTAPVTGRYQFNALINWSSFDTDFGFLWHKFTVSNRTIYASLASGQQQRADGYATYSGSVLVDMDASDTCKFQIQVSNAGAAQADIAQSTFFSGFLAC